jgi:hypothetical protein
VSQRRIIATRAWHFSNSKALEMLGFFASIAPQHHCESTPKFHPAAKRKSPASRAFSFV